jgi:hypothetical protein
MQDNFASFPSMLKRLGTLGPIRTCVKAAWSRLNQTLCVKTLPSHTYSVCLGQGRVLESGRHLMGFGRCRFGKGIELGRSERKSNQQKTTRCIE